MNEVIREKLIEVERPLAIIEQQYNCTINLDRHQRKSQREKERLKGRRERGNQKQQQIEVVNN